MNYSTRARNTWPTHVFFQDSPLAGRYLLINIHNATGVAESYSMAIQELNIYGKKRHDRMNMISMEYIL